MRVCQFRHTGMIEISGRNKKMEAATGIEPVIRELQSLALPLGYAAEKKMERKTGFEPATPTLARWYSSH